MENKELKETLLLPKTTFPLKVNTLNQQEIFTFWENSRIYEKTLVLNKKGEKFIVHDGPLYANGPIHIGHFVNKILKDILVRFHSSVGFQSPFRLGWDTHGLPIELKVLSQKNLSSEVVRIACRDYANKQIEFQKDQLDEFGLFTKLQGNYSTDDKSYQAEQLRVLAKLVDKNLVYRGLRPIYWSWSHQTALAENEVEYLSKEDYSLFFTFSLKDEFLGFSKVSLLMWTTQPWTVPANMLAAVKGSEFYLLVKIVGMYLVCSDEYYQNFLVQKKEVFVVKSFTGKSLLGLFYENPYFPKHGNYFIVDGSDFVVASEGTGILHVAPACGPEDFLLAEREKLQVKPVLDEKGNFLKSFGFSLLDGVFYQNASKWVVNDLEEKNLLYELSKIFHSYPHDWRDKNPLIYRLTSQWFIELAGIRSTLLRNIEKVEWFPAYSKDKMISFINSRNSWCISRQRMWGVPIPSVLLDGSEKLIPEVINFVADFVERNGPDFWFNDSGLKLLRTEYSKKIGTDFLLGTDTLDVWFDSGVSSLCVLATEENFPADVYLEGGDQFRGWFNSSLILSTIIRDSAPFKKVISHGFTVDGNGKKMSKSLGNVVDPSLLNKKFGIDTLRLWVASVDFTKEIKVSLEIISKTHENYQKIRNSLRFLIASLSSPVSIDFELAEQKSPNDFVKVNEYVTVCIQKLASEVRNDYQNLRFSNIANAVNNFCANKLSSFYFEIVKDSLYCDNFRSRNRLSILGVFNILLKYLLKIISPIMPTLAEEVYQNIRSNEHNFLFVKDTFYQSESVHLLKYPEVSQKISENFEIFEQNMLNTRKQVFRQLEEARRDQTIELNQQAEVVIRIDNQNWEQFEWLFVSKKEELLALFLIADLKLIRDDFFSIEIVKTTKTKCKRCWKFNVLAESQEPFCLRCLEILANN